MLNDGRFVVFVTWLESSEAEDSASPQLNWFPIAEACVVKFDGSFTQCETRVRKEEAVSQESALRDPFRSY
jgi:hypothetical protein